MLNINKSLNKKIILEILNFNFINEEVCVNPRISEFYYKNFYICKMGSPEYMKLSFNEQIIIFKNKLKEIIVNNKLEFPIEYIQFILDTDKYKSLYNKNILYLLNDNKIRLFYYNTFINICEFEENKFNYEEIMNNYEKVKLQYEIVYLKLNNLNMYNINDINKVFYENKYCVIFIENIENLIPNTKLIVCNNDSELAENVEQINQNHSIYIIKNSFCYDTIPTPLLWKIFKNIDVSDITYFDSGIHSNIPHFKNLWASNNINYNIVKHTLLNYDFTNCLDYKSFCSINNLDSNKKLAVWYINSCRWLDRPSITVEHIMRTQFMEYYEGDLYLFKNFDKIRKIFEKNGYNLIIKEHRRADKRIKFYLDYVKEFDETFNLYSEKQRQSLVNHYKRFIKPGPHLECYNLCKKLYSYIINNKYEKEILKYSDIALIGSCTSISNILYSYDCKCLFLKNIKNEDYMNLIIKRFGLDFKYKGKQITHHDLLNGISVNIDEFDNNVNKHIKQIINYNKEYEYKYDHPYYGNSFITNYDFFNKIIQNEFNKKKINVIINYHIHKCAGNTINDFFKENDFEFVRVSNLKHTDIFERKFENNTIIDFSRGWSNDFFTIHDILDIKNKININNKNVYLVTSLREPKSHSISLFNHCYVATLGEKINDKNLLKQIFIDHYSENKIIKNFIYSDFFHKFDKKEYFHKSKGNILIGAKYDFLDYYTNSCNKNTVSEKDYNIVLNILNQFDKVFTLNNLNNQLKVFCKKNNINFLSKIKNKNTKDEKIFFLEDVENQLSNFKDEYDKQLYEFFVNKNDE